MSAHHQLTRRRRIFLKHKDICTTNPSLQRAWVWLAVATTAIPFKLTPAVAASELLSECCRISSLTDSTVIYGTQHTAVLIETISPCDQFELSHSFIHIDRTSMHTDSGARATALRHHCAAPSRPNNSLLIGNCLALSLSVPVSCTTESF